MSSYAVINPATGEKVQEYPEITDSELDAAIGKAWDAHVGWGKSSAVADRAAMIQKVADLHIEISLGSVGGSAKLIGDAIARVSAEPAGGAS